MAPQNITLQPIGIIHSCFVEKFGIPRQPGLVKSATARLELLSPYNREEMVRGLEQFSHIWLQFIFHETVEEGWKPTIRPPWLGGQRRVGIFASRSPHRPNHLGLSVVRLNRIVQEGKNLYFELSGVDLLDKTPVVDIKPYISYSDKLKHTYDGYAIPSEIKIQVTFADDVISFCHEYQQRTGRKLQDLIHEVLEQDPRPASQRGRQREYGMLLWDVNVRWSVEGNTFFVTSCAEVSCK